MSESVSGIIFDARLVWLEGANHGVEADGRAKKEFVGRISEDESGRAACIGAEGDGVKDGDDGPQRRTILSYVGGLTMGA